MIAWLVLSLLLLLSAVPAAADIWPKFISGTCATAGATLFSTSATKIACDATIIDATAFSGADAGIKIAAAIAALPAAGGVVDARGLACPCTIASDPRAGSTKPFLLLLGPGVYTVTSTSGSSSLTVTSHQSLVGMGEGTTTIKGSTFTTGALSHGIIEIASSAIDAEVAHLTITTDTGLIGVDPRSSTLMEAGIRVRSATRARLHDLELDHIYASGGHIYATDVIEPMFWNIRSRTWAYYSAAGGSTGAHPQGGHHMQIRNLNPLDTYGFVRNVLVEEGGGFGFAIHRANFVKIKNIRAYGANDDTLEGINHAQSNYVEYEDIVVNGRGDGGFTWADFDLAPFTSSVGVHIRGFTGRNNRAAGLFLSGISTVAENVLVEDNGRGDTHPYGVIVDNTGLSGSVGVVLRNVVARDNGSVVTGNTTNGSAVVMTLSRTSGFVKGMPVAGTGIPANTVILSIDSASQITLSKNAAATGTGVTLTVGRTQDYGVAVAAGAQNTVITGLVTEKYVVGPYADSGTNTKIETIQNISDTLRSHRFTRILAGVTTTAAQGGEPIEIAGSGAGLRLHGREGRFGESMIDYGSRTVRGDVTFTGTTGVTFPTSHQGRRPAGGLRAGRT